MHRTRSFSLVLGVSCLAVLALVLAAVGPAAARVNAQTAAKVTVVTVTAGKPSELAFKLSKISLLPAGTITFNVTNQGVAFHDFKLCTTPVTTDAKNACVGKVTTLLHHGDKATLTVKLTKTGLYEYLCTVSGHAAAGMKGLIGVGVKVSASALVSKSASGSTGGTTTTSSTGGGSTTGGGGSTTGGGGAAGGGGAGGGGGAASECPAGQTIAANGPGDQDDDDTGAVSDGDGCI